MQRTYPLSYRHAPNDMEFFKQSAFHVAGYVTAVYFGHQQKNLPLVFFQIESPGPFHPTHRNGCVKVSGGQLIQNIDIFTIEHYFRLSSNEQNLYRLAYEADVVSLLVAALAEARYTAIRDAEPFTYQLISLDGLAYYGGGIAIQDAIRHLSYLLPSEQDCQQKICELFAQAFKFIESPFNWQKTCQLAAYLLNAPQPQISCEQAIAILDA